MLSYGYSKALNQEAIQWWPPRVNAAGPGTGKPNLRHPLRTASPHHARKKEQECVETEVESVS